MSVCLARVRRVEDEFYTIQRLLEDNDDDLRNWSISLTNKVEY